MKIVLFIDPLLSFFFINVMSVPNPANLDKSNWALLLFQKLTALSCVLGFGIVVAPHRCGVNLLWYDMSSAEAQVSKKFRIVLNKGRPWSGTNG